MNILTNRIAFRQYDASRCNWKTCKQKVRIFICTDFCPILWPVGIKNIVADDCIITWWRQKKDNGSWSLVKIVDFKKSIFLISVSIRLCQSTFIKGYPVAMTDVKLAFFKNSRPFFNKMSMSMHEVTVLFWVYVHLVKDL